MNDTKHADGRRHSGPWWKLLIIIVILSIVITATAMVSMDFTAKHEANRALNNCLPAGGNVTRGLAIRRVGGFGAGGEIVEGPMHVGRHLGGGVSKVEKNLESLSSKSGMVWRHLTSKNGGGMNGFCSGCVPADDQISERCRQGCRRRC